MWASLAWDGALPAAVAMFPWFVDSVFPGNGAMAAFAAFAVPLGAAGFRAHIAEGQIRKVCGGEVPLGRQVLLAFAIVVLLACEVAIALLTFENNRPPNAWAVPASAYAVYTAAVTLALRRPRAPEWDEF